MSATGSGLMRRHHSGASAVRSTVMWLRFAEENANVEDVEKEIVGKGSAKNKKYRPNVVIVKAIITQEQYNVLKELWKRMFKGSGKATDCRMRKR